PGQVRPKDKPPVRAAGRIAAAEVSLALLVAVGSALAGRFLWALTELSQPGWEIPEEYWRAGQVVWISGTLLLALLAVVGYLGWRRQSPDEARLLLADRLWAETRRERRRIQGWTAWAKWRVRGLTS